MEIKEILALLEKLRNEDETKWFESLKFVLDHYHKSGNEKYRELIFDEYNRLTKDINESISKEKL